MECMSNVVNWIVYQEQLNQAFFRELRETVYVFQGYADLMAEIPGEMQESVRWRYEKSRDCLERLVQSWELVQIYLYRQIELNKTRVDLKRLIKEETEKCSKQAAEENISFHISPEKAIWILGDENRLRLMLQNVLQHIMRVIPENETIKIDLWNDEQPVLQIQESACGISERERAFLLGNLISNAEEENIESNSAITLAASGIIAKAHGGRVEVDTINPKKKHKGTCYTFRFQQDTGQ